MERFHSWKRGGGGAGWEECSIEAYRQRDDKEKRGEEGREGRRMTEGVHVRSSHRD